MTHPTAAVSTHVSIRLVNSITPWMPISAVGATEPPAQVGQSGHPSPDPVTRTIPPSENNQKAHDQGSSTRPPKRTGRQRISLRQHASGVAGLGEVRVSMLGTLTGARCYRSARRRIRPTAPSQFSIVAINRIGWIIRQRLRRLKVAYVEGEMPTCPDHSRLKQEIA